MTLPGEEPHAHDEHIPGGDPNAVDREAPHISIPIAPIEKPDGDGEKKSEDKFESELERISKEQNPL